ncbi:MAG: hypothetical protein P0Y65_13520 [Candidatus Devosia phytovorans]|uniref:Uncharacterized protein n=1 Tax=Candidatus Devosia phytovorans TaxID=3121372 RepID=A0AAJ6B076_9HYPH|nr:hypothetical protein [Devosia sp.]WEK03218.1 MAG: hypothetical protein P0Y65_13520 [Devosia sp.]
MTRHWMPMNDDLGDITMAYNGVLLVQIYDWEANAPARELWVVMHYASGLSMAVLTVGEDRAKDITANIAELRDWPKLNAFSWEGDAGFIDLLASFAGEAEMAMATDEFGGSIPYGANDASIELALQAA